MGRRNRTLVTEPSLFFVTTTLLNWRPMFSKPVMLNELQQQLFELFPVKANALMGYVLMPSHVHLFVGCAKGGVQLAELMRTFKSLTARRLFPGEGSIWMVGFDDLVIRSPKQFNVKLKYMHENPLRSGLVDDIFKWKWSSARFWHSEEPHPVLTKDWDWMDS
jgi:putative transposase